MLPLGKHSRLRVFIILEGAGGRGSLGGKEGGTGLFGEDMWSGWNCRAAPVGTDRRRSLCLHAASYLPIGFIVPQPSVS